MEVGPRPVGAPQHPQQTKHPRLIIGKHSTHLHSAGCGRLRAGRGRDSIGTGLGQPSLVRLCVTENFLETRGAVTSALGFPASQDACVQRRDHLSGCKTQGVLGGCPGGSPEGTGFIKWPLGWNVDLLTYNLALPRPLGEQQ